jgi:hypothetical protein
MAQGHQILIILCEDTGFTTQFSQAHDFRVTGLRLSGDFEILCTVKQIDRLFVPDGEDTKVHPTKAVITTTFFPRMLIRGRDTNEVS